MQNIVSRQFTPPLNYDEKWYLTIVYIHAHLSITYVVCFPNLWQSLKAHNFFPNGAQQKLNSVIYQVDSDLQNDIGFSWKIEADSVYFPS